MAILTEPRYTNVGIRISENERPVFYELARRLHARSMGEAVRTVVHETVRVLREQELAGEGSPMKGGNPL